MPTKPGTLSDFHATANAEPQEAAQATPVPTTAASPSMSEEGSSGAPVPLLLNLPEGVLARIILASDPDSRRQLRLASRSLRPLVDASTPTLTLSSYSLPVLAARGRVPDFAPELRSIVLELQDTPAPSAVLARLPRLGLPQLPHLSSVTLALCNDHILSPTALPDLAAALPPSTTRLVVTHMLGAARPTGHNHHNYQPRYHHLLPQYNQQQQEGQYGRGQLQAAAASAAAQGGGDGGISGGGSGSGGASAQLDCGALRHLLLLCPQLREIRLEGGCWVRNGGDLRALASLVSMTAPAAAAAELPSPPPAPGGAAGGAGGAVTISSIRGLYLDAADGYLDLPRTLAALTGLAALDVQLVPTPVRQAPPAAGAADGGAAAGYDVGGLLADMAAALNLAHMGLASEQLLRGLASPALSGLTRLVVRDFQGSTMALLGALEGLPQLAHLGLSGLDDAPYITDAHLELLARVPRLTHLAVDRLDISQPTQPLQRFGALGGTTGALLPGLTGLEVALVVHSVPRLPHIFPAVQQLTLRWLWEQAMRKLAGWTSLTSLSLSNLDCCLDWGLMRTLTGLTQLQLCRGSSYEQLAELLYLLRALPGLAVLRLSGWHCMKNSEPGRMALGLMTRGLGHAAAAGEVAAAAGAGMGEGEEAGERVEARPRPRAGPCAPASPRDAAASCSSAAAGTSTSTSAAMAAAFAALDPELHAAWGRIRSAASDATSAAAAALGLLRALPGLRSLELHDCGHPLLRCLAAPALLAGEAGGGGGPLTCIRELRLCRMLDVVGADVEEAAAALPRLRRLVVFGCWPVDGEALLRLEGLRRAGVDVVWRR